MSDSTGNWPKWVETTAKVVAAVAVVAAVVVMATTVGGIVAGTLVGQAAVKSMFVATVCLGAATSGINGGVANEANGNSFLNGYVGGMVSGSTQAAVSRLPGGTVWGGAIGTSAGSAITDVLNNIDPDSANKTPDAIKANAITSFGKAVVTSTATAFWNTAIGGYNYNTGAFEGALANGANGLMPTLTPGFGEGIKAFFGALDDAMVYVWG